MSQEVKRTPEGILVVVNKEKCPTCGGTGRLFIGTKHQTKCYICGGVGETIINQQNIKHGK